MKLTRRQIIVAGAAATGIHIAPQPVNAAAAPAFSFVHITDVHIQRELDATAGVHKAFDAVQSLKIRPDFGLIGGDLVMDASMVSHDRADRVYELWRQEAAALKFPLHFSVGNHDLYGLDVGGKPATDDPDYGKHLWKKRLGLANTFSTFDHHGWRFIILDSAGVTPDFKWEGSLSLDQIKWLDDLLRQTSTTMPLIFLTHYPIVTAFTMYTDGPAAAPTASLIVKNGKTFLEMIQKHNVKAVFQGHTHIVEEIDYLGVRYITGGAICGEWWKGPRLGVHPEGFAVAEVRGNDLTWRYVPYGWKAQTANA